MFSMRRAATLVLALFLAACGGGGNGTGGSGNTATPKTVNGVFVDSPVSGLDFASPLHSGFTAADGGYVYTEGETLAFKLGCLAIGQAPGRQVLTPYDLVAGASLRTPATQNPPALTNIARLLASLDADADPRNGISLSDAARAAAAICANVSGIRFDVPIDRFALPGSPAQRFVAQVNGGELVPVSPVQQALQVTANQILANGAPNRLPSANAGAAQSVDAAALVTLSGLGTDPDGRVVAYEWTQTAGAPVALSDAHAASPTFTAPTATQAQALSFALVVTDNDAGRSQPSAVTVNVRAAPPSANQPPVVDAGSAQTVTSGDSVTLSGSASDADGRVVSVAWTQIDANPPVSLSGASSTTARFIAPVVTQATVYTFRLTATDDKGASASADVRVTVNKKPDTPVNQPPTADAGQDQIVDAGALVTLAGSGSDPEGQPLTYLWQQIGTPAVQLSNATTATAQFVAPQVSATTTLQFRLTVTDDQGASASDTALVTVQPNPQPDPSLSVADASAAQSSGVLNFVVTLSAASGKTVTVSYNTQDGSARSGSDYSAASGTLSFSPGQTTQTIAVMLSRHTVKAPDKTLSMLLSAPVNATLARAQATGTIVDDNPAAVCAQGRLCAGAAKRSIAPAQAFIDGVAEDRLPGLTVLQQFHLGGFGFGPFEFSKYLSEVTGGAFSDRSCFPGTDTCVSNEAARHAYYCRDYRADCTAALRDQTWVRAFYLSQPAGGAAGTQMLFVTLDAIGAGNLIQDGMKAAISAATGVPADLIVIGQTHSHASADLQGLWGGVPDDWVRNTLYKNAAEAAKAAKDAAQPATLTYATGEDAAFANYRRPRVDLNAHTDPALSVLQAKDNDGNVLGTIVQYAAHPTSIGTDSNGGNGRIVHADYVLGLEDAMEAASGGATTLYYNGPIADASPGGETTGVNDYERVRSRGQCLAQSALALLDPRQAVCGFSKLKRNSVRQTVLDPTLQVTQKTAVLPVTNPLFLALGASGQLSRYYDFSPLPLSQVPLVGAQLALQQPNLPQIATTASTLVSRITIGGAGKGLEIVTIPGEGTNTYGQYIRALTPNKNMMLLGLTHNSFGYIIPEDEFSYIDPSGSAGFVLPFTGYEEFVSLGPLTAPLLRLQAYNPLFGIAATDPRNIPPSINACADNPASNACVVWRELLRLDYIQRSYAATCRSNLAANVPGDAGAQAEAFCSLLDPQTPLYQPCVDAGLPDAVCNTLGSPAGTTPPGSGTPSPYGGGALGALSQFMADLNSMIAALLAGDAQGTSSSLQNALGNLSQNATTLAAAGFPGVLGLGRDPAAVLTHAVAAKREAAPVILTGLQLPALSVRAAQGAPYPYPSGANITGQCDSPCDQSHILDPLRDPLHLGELRDAHNGIILYPPADASSAPMGIPVERIAAYAWNGSAFVEIPAQVDQKFPFFLANAGSSFSIYSGTDEELTYQWDRERWSNADPADPVAHFASTVQDPVSGFDDDDELAFMYSDAGSQALTLAMPADPNLDGSYGLQEVALVDPLSKDPTQTRFVYVGVKKAGATSQWFGKTHYVNYLRDNNADQWIDKYFFRDDDPQKLGVSNTNYGPNHHGKVAPGDGFYGNPSACNGDGADRLCDSTDRFARDGVTVTTDQYIWRASGRWMVREISVAQPDKPGLYGPDLIDRWKGRAFQQSPDSSISLVGFEDEQVNWEANSTLLGERCGPVRCMREVWGADSGTNVTKTETFYRGNVTYRYHVRVHPIPPDGLYTSWDYNRSAMVPTADEARRGIAGGRYYTLLRPQGVPIDGVNDDVGQIDNVFGQPAFFDFPDPTFNLPLAFDSWEQVSGKGNYGSLVYTFELKGATSLANPLVVPYYRDDACLDDGTGDDPVQRPYPGDASTDARVRGGYAAIAGKPYGQLSCAERQGAYGEHGIHYLITHDSDNAFILGKPVDEIDGQQWQFMVPTATPQNVAEPYVNNVRIPLIPVVVPRPGVPALDGAAAQGGVINYLAGLGTQIQNLLGALASMSADAILDAGRRGVGYLVDGLQGLLYTGGAGSVSNVIGQVGGGDGSLAGVLGGLLNGVGNVVLGTPAGSKVRVGVGVVDMTPDVGYCAGQYCDYSDIADGLAGGDIDPYLTHKLKRSSYGVQSRLSARAIVVEGSNGKKIALLKSDNYLAQDLLIRRVGQILDQGKSGIGYAQILYHVTHNHSAAYSSSPAVGVALFQDAFDPRFFENQARRLAAAIEIAAANLQPARMGATVIQHRIYKGNIVRPQVADDGTPAGYPLEYNDHGLTVIRFDAVDASGNYSKPIATWINWGEHPESLDGYNLHSADYLGPLERWVERETGAPLVFSQGDVGSSEASGNTDQRNADDGRVCGTAADASQCPFGQGALRDWEHKGYAQTERNARFLADDVVKAWNQIGRGDASVVIAPTRDFPVDYLNDWVPGPLSHPYPSISNCRTQTTLEGDPGVPAAGLPDCARRDSASGVDGGVVSGPLFDGWQEIARVSHSGMIYALLKAEGVPVPENYDAPAFSAVEENLRLKLQTFRLGEILLASCACEAQNDLVLNIKSRLDAQRGNIYDGFDWACLMPQYAGDPQYTAACETQKKYFDPAAPLNATLIPGTAAGKANAALIAHLRAQVHNDARGWDSAQNLLAANAESADIGKIWGNFTKEEIQDLGIADGYKLPVAVGHAGDYNGYTVSYREYMNRDSYRKALTSYGPHTGDYMATRLVRMAAQLKGGPDFVPEAHDALAQADELRQQALAVTLGQATSAAYDAFHAALADDLGPAAALTQPQDITRFAAATFSWRGGTTAQDNPLVSVERCTLYPKACSKDADWARFADMSGEVQTRVAWPQGVAGVIAAYTGTQEWKWTANFEAYSAFPARLGTTPEGQYRFRVSGKLRKNRAPADYSLVSAPFRVQPWSVGSGVSATRNGNALSFAAADRSVNYPKSYAGSPFPFVTASGDAGICNSCAFRPWAVSGELAARGDVAVLHAGAVSATRSASCRVSGSGIACTADLSGLGLANGDQLLARIYDQDGNFRFAQLP